MVKITKEVVVRKVKEKKGILLALLGVAVVGATLYFLTKKSSPPVSGSASKSISCSKMNLVGSLLSYDLVSAGYTNPSYVVDFGDGKKSSAQTGNYNYVSDGTFTITATVTEAGDVTTTKSCQNLFVVKGTAPKLTVQIAHPSCSANDKQMATDLNTVLSSLSSLSTVVTSVSKQCSGAVDISGVTSALIIIGGSTSWNDCMSDKCNMYSEFGFNCQPGNPTNCQTTFDKTTWFNVANVGVNPISGTRVYAIGGFSAQDTAKVINTFLSLLDKQGSNIAKINKSDVVNLL